MQDFINPKSMLTPGLAGSLMMFLVNGIVLQFPELSPRYLGLFISFMIGSIVWFSQCSEKSIFLEKMLYWTLNSLVIFVVGFGATHLAAGATDTSSNNTSSVSIIPFISNVLAQESPPLSAPISSDQGQREPIKPDSPSVQATKAMEEELKQKQVENDSLKKQIETLQRSNKELLAPKKPNNFFKRW